MANANPGNVIRRKLVIIGDGACGKTSLLSVFTLGYFPTHYIPTVFENYVTDCRVDGKSVQLALWDTAGQEDYERLRPLAYSKAHVILIGFSVDSPDSLDNVKHKVRYIHPRAESRLQASKPPANFKSDKPQWIEEATERCPDVPIILVGLKKDLRDDPVAIEEMRKKSLKFVAERQGEAVAQEVGARKYLECSSLSGEGVDDVFEAATRAALLTFEKGEGGGCCVVL
ncbi:GTP-binding protein rho2 [Apiospora aurea]|uniref:GTP-binding protein rho2 n=1 Tax=Apiospora aurea TaxID=335848 RepID=A0ABR1PXU6_9PEZI